MEAGHILIDPFGFRIVVMEKSCYPDAVTNNPEIFDSFRSVIEKPAFIIICQNPRPERYYYRSIGWDTTFLIRAQLNNDYWEANECTVDPKDDDIKKLAANGRIVSVDLPQQS